MLFQLNPEEYLSPDQLFVLLAAALHASRHMCALLKALSSRTELDPLPSFRASYLYLLQLLWDPVMIHSATFKTSIRCLMHIHQTNDGTDLNYVLDHITQDMENIMKHCRTGLTETHVFKAAWKSQYSSVSAKSQPSTLGYVMDMLRAGISPFKNSPTASEPPTLSLILEFLKALSQLSLAVEGIEVYWGKRLCWARQFGGPLSATWEQVAAVAPAWEKLSSLC